MKNINKMFFVLLLTLSCCKKVDSDADLYVGEYDCLVSRIIWTTLNNCDKKQIQLSDTLVLLKIEKYNFDGLIIHIPLTDNHNHETYTLTIESLSNYAYPFGYNRFIIPLPSDEEIDLSIKEDIITIFQRGAYVCKSPEYFYEYLGIKR